MAYFPSKGGIYSPSENEESNNKIRKNKTATTTATESKPTPTPTPRTTSERKSEQNRRKSQQQQQQQQRRYRIPFVKTAGGLLPSSDAYRVNRDGHIKNEKNHFNRDVYIDDYDLEERTRIARVERRLQYIEECLGKSNIIKAEPITALIYTHESAQFIINKVYHNWIRFMGHVAQQLMSRTIENLFGAADQYLFEGWFEIQKNLRSPPLNYHFIDYKENVLEVNKEILNLALEGDRDQNGKLLYPQDCEYINLYLDNTTNNVYIFYSINELINIYKTKTDDDKNYINKDNDRSLVSGLDAYSLVMPGADKRYKVLGSHRILYNTFVNMSNGEMFNTSLNGMGMSALNVCVIIVHAMIHLKCLLDKNILPTEKMRHSNKHFIEEVIKHVPSTLFGHPMLPIVTFKDQ